ncbi:hypothetical protein [Cyanobium sp. Morenito 9A2]|uniref:hypothetical protein n=1 Tax=Cyanobium sp. Morenito 9A2 TaxID=2823718 RepID=UPI0020CB6FEB|nr:hypothetical protein [Cyanobium sp. Morenito 9A2]MCP9849053.1 hypothetical protein [Cyanobium sp. Morenito 9A2]
MKSIQNLLSAFLTTGVLATAVGWHPTAQAQATAQKAAAPPSTPPAGLSKPCPVKGENWRGKAFYEILFMNREANGGGIGNYYNSLGNSFDISNEVVDARFRSLQAESLKKEYGSDGVFFNGPRRFVANGFTAVSYNDCTKRAINTIPLYLYGTFEVPSFNEFVAGPPVAYKVLVSKRTNTFIFKAGEQVNELITPEGAVYTMFSLSLKADPTNTIENLPNLGKRLTLPTGWRYRTRTLERDMILSSSYDANPPNTIVLDQFEGNYQHNPGAR